MRLWHAPASRLLKTEILFRRKGSRKRVRSQHISFLAVKKKDTKLCLQVGCHGNEVRFHPHTVFSVNQAEDAPQQLFCAIFTTKSYGSFVSHCDVTLRQA